MQKAHRRDLETIVVSDVSATRRLAARLGMEVMESHSVGEAYSGRVSMDMVFPA